MRTTVFLCHGFVQNRLAFEVPGRSFVDAVRAAGHGARAIELRGRDGVSPAAGFSVYVGDAARLVQDAARDGRGVAWIGHSMGGLVGACLPDSARRLLSALVVIGAPVIPGPPHLHSRTLGAGLVGWARLMHARRRSFPGRPWGSTLWRVRHVVESAAPLPIRLWRPGSLEPDALTAALQRSFCADSFAVFADLLGLVHSGGNRAGDVDVGERLASLQVPLLVVAGRFDDLAPPSGACLLHDRASHAERSYLEVDAGHIDLLVGRDAPQQVWQPTLDFLRRHAPRSGP